MTDGQRSKLVGEVWSQMPERQQVTHAKFGCFSGFLLALLLRKNLCDRVAVLSLCLHAAVCRTPCCILL